MHICQAYENWVKFSCYEAQKMMLYKWVRWRSDVKKLEKTEKLTSWNLQYCCSTFFLLQQVCVKAVKIEKKTNGLHRKENYDTLKMKTWTRITVVKEQHTRSCKLGDIHLTREEKTDYRIVSSEEMSQWSSSQDRHNAFWRGYALSLTTA